MYAIRNGDYYFAGVESDEPWTRDAGAAARYPKVEAQVRLSQVARGSVLEPARYDMDGLMALTEAQAREWFDTFFDPIPDPMAQRLATGALSRIDQRVGTILATLDHPQFVNHPNNAVIRKAAEDAGLRLDSIQQARFARFREEALAIQSLDKTAQGAHAALVTHASEFMTPDSEATVSWGGKSEVLRREEEYQRALLDKTRGTDKA